MALAHEIPCQLCGMLVPDFLADHLTQDHQTTVAEYLVKFPGAPTVSKRLLKRQQAETGKALASKGIVRKHPPAPSELTIKFSGVVFPVNHDVPVEVCLPMPKNYRVPSKGLLAEDVQHTAIALKNGRSVLVHGMPGCGKDAVFHAFSAYTRTPAMIRQVKPGTDIESWFFTRSFNEQGTYWEEGDVLKALRDGYLTTSGRRVPYLVVCTDFDRADREQAEHLRLILDSIEGRIDGPAGKVYKVLPGTRIAATANTAGGGDERGRMISANPIDGSILDRFGRCFKFHQMAWADEGPVIQAKFPRFFEKFPGNLEKLSKVTAALRDAVDKGELHGEFSHRGLCAIVEHADDMMEIVDPKDFPNLLKMAARVWVDKLPDEENRDYARKLLDPVLGMLPTGDASRAKKGNMNF